MSTSRTCAWSRLPGRTPCWTPRETLRDCGYDGALSIEQEDYTIPLEEALQKAVSLLRQALPA